MHKRAILQECCIIQEETKINRFRRSIAGAFTFSGVGIHTGKQSQVRVEPIYKENGIVFHKDGVQIPVHVDNVVETTRCTCLGKDGVSIQTVEHLLSAAYGMGIDNLNVYVEGDEMPILDGSAKYFADKFYEIGLVEIGAVYRDTVKIEKPVCVSRGDSYIAGMPSDSFSVSCLVDYNHPVVGVQACYFNNNEFEYRDNIAPARTFGFWEEIKGLLEKKLAQGGSLDNAIVVKQDGYMNPPRFPDEIVRHKMLDLIGDLAMTAGTLVGHIMAVKPSHSLNIEFIRTLLQGLNQEERKC